MYTIVATNKLVFFLFVSSNQTGLSKKGWLVGWRAGWLASAAGWLDKMTPGFTTHMSVKEKRQG